MKNITLFLLFVAGVSFIPPARADVIKGLHLSSPLIVSGSLGVELQVGNASFLGSLGGYRRMEGDDPSWLASVGLGLRS